MRKIVKMSDGLITPDDLHIKRNQMSFDTCVIITAKNCKSEGSQEIKVCKNRRYLAFRYKNKSGFNISILRSRTII